MTPNPLLFYFDDRGSFFEKCPLMVSKNGAIALGKTTLSIKTLSIPIKMTLSITINMILSIKTLSIPIKIVLSITINMILSIKTLSIPIKMALSITINRILSITTLNIATFSIIILGVMTLRF
jgi:uncharacterized protein YpmS